MLLLGDSGKIVLLLKDKIWRKRGKQFSTNPGAPNLVTQNDFWVDPVFGSRRLPRSAWDSHPILNFVFTVVSGKFPSIRIYNLRSSAFHKGIPLYLLAAGNALRFQRVFRLLPFSLRE